MRTRVKRWTAWFLLLVSGAAFASLVGSMYCAVDVQATASDAVAVVSPQPSANSDETACPMATLAEFVTAPMVVTPVVPLSVTRPAHVAALYLSPRYRVDPEPPTKPPAA